MITEVPMNLRGRHSYGCNEVGAIKSNTSDDHTSHQSPEWLDVYDSGPELLQSECTSESPRGLVKTQLPGPLIQRS